MSRDDLEALGGAVHLQDELVLGQAKGRLVLYDKGQALLLSDQLHYSPRLGEDELLDGQLSWKVQSRQRDALCELVARHRLGLEVEVYHPLPIESHVYLESSHPWWIAWLIQNCEEEEDLLASLRLGERKDIASAYDRKESVELFLVWTSQRVYVAGGGRMGDIYSVPLELPLQIERSLRRDSLRSGAQRISVTKKHTDTLLAMVQVTSLPSTVWRAGVVAMVLGSQGRASAGLLAGSATYLDDAAVAWAQPLWRDVRASELAPDTEVDLCLLWNLFATHAQLTSETPESVSIEEVDAWLGALSVDGLLQDRCFSRPWPFGRFLGYAFVSDRKDMRASRLALLNQLKAAQEPVDDLESVQTQLARALILSMLYQRVGASQSAHDQLNYLIEALPDARELELLVGEEQSQAPIRHLLDALVQRALAIWPEDAPQRCELLKARASLDPLSLSRLDAWLDASDPQDVERPTLCRVRDHLAALKKAPEPNQEPLPSRVAHHLSDAQIETQLAHPAARTKTAGSLQALLAKLEVPDHSALKKYCDPGHEGVLAKEIALAAALFDRESVDVFISHGDRRFGVQAHEGDPSFLLVGGEHRRLESPAFLEPTQLRFTVGAELAHLYLGHARVTSQEVLSGALDKGKATFEMLSSLVPFLSAFPWGKRLGRWTGYFDNKLVSRSARKIREYFGDISQKREQVLTMDRSVGLIAAHRMMQLTADRAGLLLCDHLGDAILAMWKLRPQSLEYVELLRQDGLAAAIEAMQNAGREEWRMLSIRASALTAFALSAEYSDLRTEVWGHG